MNDDALMDQDDSMALMANYPPTETDQFTGMDFGNPEDLPPFDVSNGVQPMGQNMPPPLAAMPVRQGGLEGWLNANYPDMVRVVRPDGSLIADSYRNIPGAPVPPPPKFDPMQELGRLAYSGNRQAQHAFINALQFQSGLSYREKLQMQKMQAAIGAITNDSGLMFPEKVNAIRQLQTGINFLEQRDKSAQMKALAERRQAQAEEIKQQAAQMAAIQNMNAAQLAEWSDKHIKTLPNGTQLYFGIDGKMQVIKNDHKEVQFDELKARKLAQEQVESMSPFAPEAMKGLVDEKHKSKEVVNSDGSVSKLLDQRLAARNRLIEMKVEGMRAEHEMKNGGVVPQTARENPQAEYDAIKKRFPGGAKTIQDPAILNRVRELRALGAQ